MYYKNLTTSVAILAFVALGLFPSLALAEEKTNGVQSTNTKLEHKVGPTETLMQIAALYEVKASHIKDWNNLSSLSAPRGSVLTIYVDSEKAQDILAARTQSQTHSMNELKYTVSKGDTLSTIAQSYSVNMGDVVLWNRLSDSNLRNGQVLTLFVSDEAYAVAKMDLDSELADARSTATSTAVVHSVDEVAVKSRSNNFATRTVIASASDTMNDVEKEDKPGWREKRKARKSAEKAARNEKMELAKEVEVEVETEKRTINIPSALPHPSKVVDEFMIINTEELHGFGKEELKMASAQQSAIAMSVINQGVNMSATPFGDYVIGSADVLEFISFNDKTLNRKELIVRYDGHVSLPLIPDVKVGGLTRTDAEDIIREAYASVYREPEISLTVLTPESKTYNVIGDVQTAGRYAYTRQTSLFEAISQAGGLRERNAGGSSSGGVIGMTGQITRALVIRNVNGQRQVFDYDMRGIGKPGNHAGDTPIYYGDIVYVPEGMNLVYLLGEGNAPRAIELTEGMTLLRMLSFGGGFNSSTSRLREVVLLREVDNENTEVQLINVRELLKKGGQDIHLKPGDVVYIPQKHLVRTSEFVARFTGSISPLFDMYNKAIESFYSLDISSQTLEALKNQNANVNIGVRGGTIRLQNLGR